MPYICRFCRDNLKMKHIGCSATLCECRCHTDWEFRRLKRKHLEAREAGKIPATQEATMQPQPDPTPHKEIVAVDFLLGTGFGFVLGVVVALLLST